MIPFRTSLTARLLSIATFVVLTGPGLALALDLNPSIAVPLCIAIAITLSLFGMIVGTADHPATILLLAIVLPLALWGYVMGLESVVTAHRDLAWALIAAGFVPLIATLSVSRAVEAAAPKQTART